MASKPKLRKKSEVAEPDAAAPLAQPPELPRESAAAAPVPPDSPPAAPDGPETPAPALDAAIRPKRRKKPAPAIPSLREPLRSVDDRLKMLGPLPSLGLPPPEAETAAAVDTLSGPPPSPAAPPQQEPAAGEALDRGAPIPEHYSMDRLVALMRDPNWLYVYWELKGGALERLRFQHSAEIIDNSRWVLRVRSLRELTEYLVDINLRSGQWYLKVAPDSSFSLDLGFVNHQGDFVQVVQGNQIRTPRVDVSNVVDERWAVLREELEQLLRVTGVATPGLENAALGGSDSAPRLVRSELPRALGLFSGSMPRPKE